MPAYKDKTGRWRYRFAYNGERYSGSAPKGHNTKKAAERIERQQLEKLMAGSYTGRMPTVKEFGARYLEHQKARTKPLTQQQQRGAIDNHLIPAFGSMRLDRLGKEQLDELATRWAADSKPKTVNVRMGVVRHMLSVAAQWDIIAKVPRWEPMKPSNATPRFLRDIEAAELIEAAEPKWKAMILIALRTGLRIGELRGLQWGDVDLGRRIVHVKRTDPGRRTMDATSPKGNRERQVPLTSDAIAAFDSIRHEKPKAHAWVWPALLKRAKEDRARVRSEKGCWHAIDRAARKASLHDVGWHTLRHTFASWCVMRGVPMRLIQKWLGHSSIKETEKYSHLAPEYGHDAIDVLDVALTPELVRQTATKMVISRSGSVSDSNRLDGKA